RVPQRRHRRDHAGAQRPHPVHGAAQAFARRLRHPGPGARRQPRRRDAHRPGAQRPEARARRACADEEGNAQIMKRSLKWLAVVAALLLVAALAARGIKARQHQRALATAPAAEAVLELSPADLVTARRIELTRSLPVSGGLKAVRSAMVKAKVAAELQALTVREGDAVAAGQVI